MVLAQTMIERTSTRFINIRTPRLVAGSFCFSPCKSPAGRRSLGVKFTNGYVDLVSVALDAGVIILDVDDKSVEECCQQVPSPYGVACIPVQLARVAE